MYNRIAQALLIHVYYDVSAVVSIAQDGTVLEAAVFDTYFAGENMRVHDEAAQVWLMTNHPQGMKELYDADRENIARLRALLRGRPLRVFITGEETGAVETGAEAFGTGETDDQKTRL